MKKKIRLCEKGKVISVYLWKKVEKRKKKSRVIIRTDIMPQMAVKRNKDGKLELFCTKTRFKF